MVFFGPKSLWVNREEEWLKSKDKAQYLESEKRGKYTGPWSLPAEEGVKARARVDKGAPYNQNNLPPNLVGEWPPLYVLGWPWPPMSRRFGFDMEPEADSPDRSSGPGGSGLPYHEDNVPPNYDGQWPPGLAYDGPWPAPMGSLFNAGGSLFSPH